MKAVGRSVVIACAILALLLWYFMPHIKFAVADDSTIEPFVVLGVAYRTVFGRRLLVDSLAHDRVGRRDAMSLVCLMHADARSKEHTAWLSGRAIGLRHKGAAIAPLLQLSSDDGRVPLTPDQFAWILPRVIAIDHMAGLEYGGLGMSRRLSKRLLEQFSQMPSRDLLLGARGITQSGISEVYTEMWGNAQEDKELQRIIDDTRSMILKAVVMALRRSENPSAVFKEYLSDANGAFVRDSLVWYMECNNSVDPVKGDDWIELPFHIGPRRVATAVFNRWVFDFLIFQY